MVLLLLLLLLPPAIAAAVMQHMLSALQQHHPAPYPHTGARVRTLPCQEKTCMVPLESATSRDLASPARSAMLTGP